MPRRGDRAGRREGRRAGRVRRRLDRLAGVVRRRARRPRRVRESGDAVGSYDAATGLWTLFPDGQAARSLPAGTSATLVVRVKIAPAAAGKKVTNAASLESLDQKDDNAANNSSKASLDVLQSVSGSVYRDSDRDGARGGGEAGVEGTKVELRDRDGAVVATATMGADGSYSFNRVPSGTATGVKVEDRLPKGLTYPQTAPMTLPRACGTSEPWRPGSPPKFPLSRTPQERAASSTRRRSQPRIRRTSI